MAAIMAGNGELALKHAALVGERWGSSSFLAASLMAEGYLILGETEQALRQYGLLENINADWFVQCIGARRDPSQWPGIAQAMRATIKRYKSGELNEEQESIWGWQIIRCGTWIGAADLVFEILLSEDVPTEMKFIPLFYPDAGVLRQHPRIRELVMKTGLLDYWRKWGWSDYCEADGDSFRCD